jgi:hypothetical protein
MSVARKIVDKLRRKSKLEAPTPAEHDAEWQAKKRADPLMVTQIYEEWHDRQPERYHQATQTNAPDASERERQKRDMVQLHAMLGQRCDRVLRQQGLRVVRVVDDGYGQHMILHVRDTYGRPFEAKLNYESAQHRTRTKGVSLVDSLVAELVSEIEKARKRYHERMQ